MIDTFSALMEAKAGREIVRHTIVKSLNRGADAEEMAGLLAADKLATTNLRIAQEAFNRIPINDW